MDDSAAAGENGSHYNPFKDFYTANDACMEALAANDNLAFQAALSRQDRALQTILAYTRVPSSWAKDWDSPEDSAYDKEN